MALIQSIQLTSKEELSFDVFANNNINSKHKAHESEVKKSGTKVELYNMRLTFMEKKKLFFFS